MTELSELSVDELLDVWEEFDLEVEEFDLEAKRAAQTRDEVRDKIISRLQELGKGSTYESNLWKLTVGYNHQYEYDTDTLEELRDLINDEEFIQLVRRVPKVNKKALDKIRSRGRLYQDIVERATKVKSVSIRFNPKKQEQR